ncbi:hypothetical protein Sru01_02950 [Sphaerisporangium rufum]|uniref:Uncharacterized protein n=1 Tax=Sphaerisporangium rufum TaxID=1381558 RepID=A0A919UZ93_9ACTN|nr:hypothetical protein Sru01_02950 [Sphaerisporangium rufum]
MVAQRNVAVTFRQTVRAIGEMMVLMTPAAAASIDAQGIPVLDGGGHAGAAVVVGAAVQSQVVRKAVATRRGRGRPACRPPRVVRTVSSRTAG